jgi:integrase
MNLILEDLEFLGLSSHPTILISEYVSQYLNFIGNRKSDKAQATAKGVLNRFKIYLDSQEVYRVDEINVKVINGYIDSLTKIVKNKESPVSPKTKKNHLQEISLMLEQAINEEIIQSNPSNKAVLPKMVKSNLHRLLDPIDLEIIFNASGSWSLYYAFLYHTGLRAGDVALLTYGNFDFRKRAITSFIRKSRRTHEFPIADVLINQLDRKKGKDIPLFPEVYAETERKLNDNLAHPRKYMQALLRIKERPHATLHSFRHTFNNSLRDLGLSIEDRQVLLAQASSSVNKIYTHPNFDLASQYVNSLPTYLAKDKN